MELKDFSACPRTRTGLRVACGILDKIDNTGSAKRKICRGRPNSATADEKIEVVEVLILSQEDQPGSHKSQQKIASMLECSQSSVICVTWYDCIQESLSSKS